MSPSNPRVVVLGSINMDLVVRCDHLPLPGETIMATSFSEIPGGKGANQAVAVARAGGDVRMIGRVGDDAFADRLIDNLVHDGVNTLAIESSTSTPSGVAVVSVSNDGENSIIVVPGANARLTEDDVETHAAMIREADVLLMQLEVPMPTVLAALRVAKQSKTLVILDPAPMPKRWHDQLLQADVICPNQYEAAAMVGYAVKDVETAKRAAADLHARGAAAVIITLGGLGAVVHDHSGSLWIEPLSITPVDTTAAGDAFAGALGVRIAGGASLIDAARYASIAGAICASRHGAQPAMPTHDEIAARMQGIDS